MPTKSPRTWSLLPIPRVESSCRRPTDGDTANPRADGRELEEVLQLADELYNPPVVIEKWEAIAVDIDGAEAERAEARTAVTRKTIGAAPRAFRLTPFACHAVRNFMRSRRPRLDRSGKVNRPLGGQEILRLASAKNTGDF